MPVVDGLSYTVHGLERAQERGLTSADLRWAMNGERRGIEEGKTLCQRWYEDEHGDRWGIFVIVNAAGTVVTCWVREG